jgi:RecB family endonuclease NucS
MFDRAANDYVVVELKHREAGYGATTQLISYMSMLRKQRADQECRDVRGILLVGSIDTEQREQFAVLAEDHRIQLATYALELTVSVLAASSSGFDSAEVLAL